MTTTPVIPVVDSALAKAPVRTVTAAGDVAAAATDEMIVCAKAVAATFAINLPASPANDQRIIVKDGRGDAMRYPISIVPAAGTIEGQASIVLDRNWGMIVLRYAGVGIGWIVEGGNYRPTSFTLEAWAGSNAHTGDTVEYTFRNVVIPGGSIGKNGYVEIITGWEMTGNTNNKTMRMYFGASLVSSAVVAASNVTNQGSKFVMNAGAENAQIAVSQGSTFGYGSATSGVTSPAENTAADVTISIRGLLAVSTDTLTLRQLIVRIHPKA